MTTDVVTSRLPRELWRHPDPKSTAMEAFKVKVNKRRNKNLETFHDLLNYSVTEIANFWEDVWDTTGIIHEGKYTSIVDESARMDSIPDWFPGVRLSWAENMLFSHSPSGTGTSTIDKESPKIAVTSVREGGTSITNVTWGELRSRVGIFSQALRAAGVKKRDRVAAVVSNSTDTLVLLLAVSAVGAIFSTSSTDMGVKGVLDRMLQIEPVLLFMDDWAVYNGKTVDLRENMKKMVQGMQAVKLFRGVVGLPRFDEPADLSMVPRSQTLANFLKQAKSDKLVFERLRFRDPHAIAYSSGTTGQPKCIVHCGGGAVLNSKKEQQLHYRLEPDSTYLQYTTTGWIMYFGAIHGLLNGARVVLYDGSPFMPNPEAFIKLIADQKVTHLGISPRYLSELQLRNISPRSIADLSSLKIVTTTGMVLPDSVFEWFYDKGYPMTAQLVNMTGGTDTGGAFATGNPLTPVYVGECHGGNLGYKIEVYEPVDSEGEQVKGTPTKDGVPGEIVCTRAFPTMPVMFWGKQGKKQYFDSYFAKFDNVWTHGDFVCYHPLTKGLIMLGRADGVLNPSGIRFGSSEIYSIIAQYFPHEITESICVGQRRPSDTDENVILFLQMKPGVPFTPELEKRIKEAIGKGLSKRHVPRYLFETHEIPTTINFKKVELPVKKIVSGVRVVPSATLSNPGCLEFYYRFVDSEGEEKRKWGGAGKSKI